MQLTQWHNPPKDWTEENGQIWVKTGLKTDFWRITDYDFIRDNGHFYYGNISGNFTATVRICGCYQALYDQGGLMICIDDHHWMKCGIEYVEGVQYASAVVTRERSDWSVAPLAGQPETLWLKVRRTGGTIQVQYSLDGADYTMLRLADFPETETVAVGLMCASPEREGFEITFDHFSVSQ